MSHKSSMKSNCSACCPSSACYAAAAGLSSLACNNSSKGPSKRPFAAVTGHSLRTPASQVKTSKEHLAARPGAGAKAANSMLLPPQLRGRCATVCRGGWWASSGLLMHHVGQQLGRLDHTSTWQQCMQAAPSWAVQHTELESHPNCASAWWAVAHPITCADSRHATCHACEPSVALVLGHINIIAPKIRKPLLVMLVASRVS